MALSLREVLQFLTIAMTVFFNTFNKFSKLLTHQHTYNTQLAKRLISCSKSHTVN